MKDCRCSHPYEGHGIGMCLATPACRCPGYKPLRTWTGPGESDEGWEAFRQFVGERLMKPDQSKEEPA